MGIWAAFSNTPRTRQIQISHNRPPHFLLARGVRPSHFPECYFGKKGGHPQRADYSDTFAEQVVQILGPGVAARMVEMRASDGKRVKVETGATGV